MVLCSKTRQSLLKHCFRRGKSGLLTSTVPWKKPKGASLRLQSRKARAYGIVPQKKTALHFYKNERVRVKTCGKSARMKLAIVLWGKPYREQGKIGMCGRLFRLNMRVCRLDTWLPMVKSLLFTKTESGLLFYCRFLN